MFGDQKYHHPTLRNAGNNMSANSTNRKNIQQKTAADWRLRRIRTSRLADAGVLVVMSVNLRVVDIAPTMRMMSTKQRVYMPRATMIDVDAFAAEKSHTTSKMVNAAAKFAAYFDSVIRNHKSPKL